MFSTKIIAQVASIPDRMHQLKKTIESLYPQVDELNIMLNGYYFVPLWLNREKINVFELDNSKPNKAPTQFTCLTQQHFIIDSSFAPNKH